MSRRSLPLEGEKRTRLLGREFGVRAEPGDVFALVGELGAGKTVFVKGLAEGMGFDPDDVTSPSFTMIAEYLGPVPLFHMDLYRLQTIREAEGIGLEEYFEAGGVCAVEWADRLPALIPDGAVRIEFAITGEKTRQVTFSFEAGREAVFGPALSAFGPDEDRV